MGTLSFPRSLHRRHAMGSVVSCIVLAALLIGRHTGIPLPAQQVGRDRVLDNDAYYFTAKWFGIRGSGGMLVRAFTDSLGKRDYKLVRGICRDRDGRELSRVVDGNGVRLLCHANGALGKLELFSDGLPTPYFLQWSETGHLRALGFVEHDTGKCMYWRFSEAGLLECAESRPPNDAALYHLGSAPAEGGAATPTGAAPPPTPAEH
jgi:hypothetical protein